METKPAKGKCRGVLGEGLLLQDLNKTSQNPSFGSFGACRKGTAFVPQPSFYGPRSRNVRPHFCFRMSGESSNGICMLSTATQLPEEDLVHILPHLRNDVISQVPDEPVCRPLVSCKPWHSAARDQRPELRPQEHRPANQNPSAINMLEFSSGAVGISLERAPDASVNHGPIQTQPD